MPLPDFRLPAVVFIALALVGCGKQGMKPPASALGVAPTYEVRDNAATRRRFNYQDQMTLADRAYQSGSLAAAEKNARSALKLDGDRPEAYLMLATLAARRGEDVAAGGLYRKAAELAPNAAMCSTIMAPGYVHMAAPPSRWSGLTARLLRRAMPHRPRRWPMPVAVRWRRASPNGPPATCVPPCRLSRATPMHWSRWRAASTPKAAISRRAPSPNVVLRLHRPHVPCYNLPLKSRRSWVTRLHPVAICSEFATNFRRMRLLIPGVEAL